MTMVDMCCGQCPLEQVSKGRRVRFCIRCGSETDAGADGIRERMHEAMAFYAAGGETREPAIMMREHVVVGRMRRRRG